MSAEPLFLHGPAVVCALGADAASVAAALFADDAPRGVRAVQRAGHEVACHLGVVDTELPALDHLPLPLRSRNNALLAHAVGQIRADIARARERYGAARIGVVIGTSTSGIAEGEEGMAAYVAHGDFPARFHLGQQELGSPAAFLRHVLGLGGPAYTISTACSSGAKAIASAARMIRAGIADAVVCGGSDSLCELTLQGFSALEAVSGERCNPMSRNRRGINIGEGAALFVLSREASGLRLAGWGESSDAHHISAPEPEGRGARDAMQAALRHAGIATSAVDYLALHGTATPLNDVAEAAAVAQVLGCDVPASSTKPLTGHTLGAAGAIGAALCALTLADSNARHALPPHWWDGERDPALAPLRLVSPGECASRRPRVAMANTFAFGGNNVTLVLAAE